MICWIIWSWVISHLSQPRQMKSSWSYFLSTICCCCSISFFISLILQKLCLKSTWAMWSRWACSLIWLPLPSCHRTQTSDRISGIFEKLRHFLLLYQIRVLQMHFLDSEKLSSALATVSVTASLIGESSIDSTQTDKADLVFLNSWKQINFFH